MTFHNQDKTRKRNVLVIQGSRKQVGVHNLQDLKHAGELQLFSQSAAASSNISKLKGHWGIKLHSRHFKWGNLKTFTAFSKLSCTDLSVCGRDNLCVCQRLLWETTLKKTKTKLAKKPPQLNHNSFQEHAAKNRPPASTNTLSVWVLSSFPKAPAQNLAEINAIPSIQAS